MRVPSAVRSSFASRSWKKNCKPRQARRSRRRSEISESRNGSKRSRPSTSATFTPSAVKMEAYSQPITPPPTTARLRGIRSISRIVSESKMNLSSKGISGGR